jgi:polyhydroxybutyrate depolymerase
MWEQPGTYEFDVEHDGKTRTAIVYVPATEGPRDLVVALHGGASSADDFREVTRYELLASSNNTVTIFPQGRKNVFWRVWNAGDCCGNVDEEHRDSDDVGYLDKLVESISPQVCGDRVLGVGFSNGGMMAARWGCEGTTPDAIVSGAGPLLRDQCEGEPIPFRHYHGLADTNVPFEGGESRSGRNVFPPALDGVELYKERNGCVAEEPDTFTFGPMSCTRWQCQASTELCTIEGWQHAWPGGKNASRLGGDSNATPDSVTFLRDHVDATPLEPGEVPEPAQE